MRGGGAESRNAVLVANTGFGKTRVAFELVAAALAGLPDRQVFIPAPHSNPSDSNWLVALF